MSGSKIDRESSGIEELDPRVYWPWFWQLMGDVLPRNQSQDPAAIFGLKGMGGLPARCHDSDRDWPRYIAINKPVVLGKKGVADVVPAPIWSVAFKPTAIEWIRRGAASPNLLPDVGVLMLDMWRLIVTDERIEAEGWSDETIAEFLKVQKRQFRELLRYDPIARQDVFSADQLAKFNPELRALVKAEPL